MPRPRRAVAALVIAAARAAAAPLAWSAPPFDTTPLAGIPLLANASAPTVIFYGSLADGFYNHGAMITLWGGRLHATWKNGVGESKEDATGQRVRWSASTDGANWSPSRVIFPSLNTSTLPVALFAGPFATINGHLYASATPAVIFTGDAQGSQFCLWPDGVDPRNAGPPGQKQPVGTLLLRRVLDEDTLGPLFWAAPAVPAGFGPASAAAGILTLDKTDAATRADVALLRADLPALPCDAAAGTNKCEAVLRGAQDYEHLPLDDHLANERSHWVVPAAHPQLGGADVLVYRSHSAALWVSVRGAAPGSAWSPVALSPVPNDDSNINAGNLPASCGGAAFIAANAVPHRARNPLTLALAPDGLNFTAVRVVLDCAAIAANSTCVARSRAGASGGPSYPQAIAVEAPAPAALRGFFVVATNNKEDVVIARHSLDAVARAAGGACA